VSFIPHSPEGKSRAEKFLLLPKERRRELLGQMSELELASLKFSWDWWARPKQKAPPIWPLVWLLLGGRGSGKTRTASQTFCAGVENRTIRRGALIAPTVADCRDVMIRGESGILSCYSDTDPNRPLYTPSTRSIQWPNGAVAFTYSAEEPERLRGPQHDFIWFDEPAACPYLGRVMEICMFGLRLGGHPKALLTTTPRPHEEFFKLLEKDTTVFTEASTWENQNNLPQVILDYLKATYEGTDLGKQELEGKLLGQAPGSLWQQAWLDTHRELGPIPAMKRIVVAIDPSSSQSKEACECGIVVVGLGVDGRGYVLADKSVKATPTEWVKIAIDTRVAWKADKIVYEGNHGGGFIVDIFRLVDKTAMPYLKAVQATVDKAKRALPISALFQKGTMRMWGKHRELEMQCCTWIPGKGKSPDRIDAMVWGAHEFFVHAQPARGFATVPGF